MSVQDIIGLVIGIAAMAAVIGYLTDVYLHPRRFCWLELPQDGRRGQSAHWGEARLAKTAGTAIGGKLRAN